jgi:glyoxylase-like metal-dependent hydrolase (beta-lactamase superfamily II)
MRVGNYQAYLIFSGSFRLDGGAMFGVVPKVLWEKKKPADEKNRIFMCTNNLLLVSENRKILVDTGNGYKVDDKFKQIYALNYEDGDLLKGLEKAGIQRGEITDVILTHLHFDHAGGATIRNDAGQIVPTFPNATYYVTQTQLDWAMNPSFKDRASYMKENFVPLMESNQLQIIHSMDSPLEGIEFIICNGHTPGQLLPLIQDEQHPLFYAGDLIPMYPHVPIPWVMAYDNNPLLTIEEKQRILSQAEKEKWILFFEHDPEISAATIQMGDKSFEIKEVITMEKF